MKIRLLAIPVGFFAAVAWIGYLVLAVNREAMIDGMTVSAVVVTILSVAFSLVSWFLFSWASRHINLQGMMLSVITGVALIAPFRGDLGPMTAVLVGIVGGFTSYVIHQGIQPPYKSKYLIIGIAIVAIFFAALLVIITHVQTSHNWDSGDGWGAWTGTPQIMEDKMTIELKTKTYNRLLGDSFN